MNTLPHQHGQPAPYMLAGPNAGDESSFDFWGVLNRRKWLVFLGLVAGMALGGLYDAQCETTYRSVAQIRIEPKDPLIMRMSSHGNNMLPNAADLVIRHDQLIGQYNIVSRCLTENQLTSLRSFENLSDEKIINEVVANLEVTQNRDEAILYELAYESSRPEDTQTILNNLITTYEKELSEQYDHESDKVANLLKDVHNDFKTNYIGLQKRLDEAQRQAHAIVVAGSQMTMHQLKVRDLGEAIANDSARLSLLDRDHTRAQEALAGGPEEIEKHVWILRQQKKLFEDGKQDGVAQTGTEVGIENRIRELEITKRQRMERLGPGHHEVKAIIATIKEWERYQESEIAARTEALAAAINPEDVLRRYLAAIEQTIFDVRSSLQANQQQYVVHEQEASRIAYLQREVKSIERQMDDVRGFIKVAETKMIEIDSGGESNRHEGFRFQRLQNATYGEPVWPILGLILGMGGLLGSLAGFGLGCLVELADKTFHNPDEIMKQLNVPLIGHVPVIGQSKRYLVENSLIEPVVCTYHRPKSQVSEAFRAVRTALYFNTQGKNHSVIQVTSPTPGDGKSTLAANLAVSIAQSGKRVLLVDADMRRPTQHTTFGITAKEGFASVLSGQSQWTDVMYECEEIEGLTIMPCGTKPNNPAELSSSPQVKLLIAEMREEFDFVVIDTPPLLAVTDPCPIAARVDGVILCLRIKKNVRVSAERATEMIANLGATCIGLVVNGVGAQSGYGSQYTYGAYRAGYSYNGYGYGYGYGYGNGKYYEEDKKGRKVPNIEEQHLESSEQPPVV